MFTIIMKHAVLTSFIYVALAFLGELLLIVFARFRGAIGIAHNRFGLGILFGIAWFLAFNLAWWILRPNS